MPKPLIRVKNKEGDYIYVEPIESRPCRICLRAFDPNDKFESLDKIEGCKAYEITRNDFVNYKLNTRVFTQCLQHLQNWMEITR